MFGYIKPFKPQMRICEYDTYKAAYCGLCKQLGSSYGVAARFTLSYDFAFLSVLSMALKDEPPQFCKERCFANPFKKNFCCKQSEASRFSACTAMIMLYYKVEDNYRDAKLFGKLAMLIAKPFAAAARNKAVKEYPELDVICAAMMTNQFALEHEGCSIVDEAAEPTAVCLSKICELLGKNADERRILQRFGYLLGRWVYLMDATDDLEDDMKSGNYNAFALQHRLTLKSDTTALIAATVQVLNQTAAEIAKTYELLELKRYKPILDNIIYLGLKNSLNLLEEKRSIHA